MYTLTIFIEFFNKEGEAGARWKVIGKGKYGACTNR